MASFPTSLDTLTNPATTDNLNNPSHAAQHGTANDILEALEAKVGIDSSAVTTSLDYKLSGVTGTDKAVSKTGTETLTNKTVNGVVLDATGAATSYLDKTGSYSTPTGATGALTLIRANSGTNATAAATNVDTASISGLTAKDSLIIYYANDTVTQATAVCNLYHNTDTTQICNLGGTLTPSTADADVGMVILRQFQFPTSGLRYSSLFSGGTVALGSGGTTGSSVVAHLQNFTTAWTGDWVLALRTGTGGVTAGGTFRWSWSVYKLAGQ